MRIIGLSFFRTAIKTVSAAGLPAAREKEIQGQHFARQADLPACVPRRSHKGRRSRNLRKMLRRAKSGTRFLSYHTAHIITGSVSENIIFPGRPVLLVTAFFRLYGTAFFIGDGADFSSLLKGDFRQDYGYYFVDDRRRDNGSRNYGGKRSVDRGKSVYGDPRKHQRNPGMRQQRKTEPFRDARIGLRDFSPQVSKAHLADGSR